MIDTKENVDALKKLYNCAETISFNLTDKDNSFRTIIQLF
jgi:hypothetical protein